MKIIKMLLDFTFSNDASIKLLDDFINTNELVAPLDYKNQLVKKLIWQIKFKGQRKYSKVAGQILWRQIKKYLINKNIKSQKILLIPVPIHKKRREERGFNQCEWLCKDLLKIKDNESKKKFNFYNNIDKNYVLFAKIEFIYESKLLYRKKYTEKQSWNNELARHQNIKNVFSINKKILHKYDCENIFIFLIDDVKTTGATISEAEKTLKELGFKKIKSFYVAC